MRPFANAKLILGLQIHKSTKKCVNDNLTTICLFFRIHTCYYCLDYRIRFMQAFWHTVQVNVAHRFCITGLGAQSSKPFLNHTLMASQSCDWQCWYHMQKVGSDTWRDLQNPVRDSHHGYSGKTLCILEHAYLSLWQFDTIYFGQCKMLESGTTEDLRHRTWAEKNGIQWGQSHLSWPS